MVRNRWKFWRKRRIALCAACAAHHLREHHDGQMAIEYRSKRRRKPW